MRYNGDGATVNGSGSVFARLIEPPKPERQLDAIPRGPLLKPIVAPADPNSTPAERFLDFVVNRWPCEVVRLREIQQFGPGSLRDRKSALALAEQLVAAGWLERVEPRRHDTRIWRVVRGPDR
jgi:hypothetical protein